MVGRRSPRVSQYIYMEEYWARWIGPLWALSVMGCNQGPSGGRGQGGGERSHSLLTWQGWDSAVNISVEDKSTLFSSPNGGNPRRGYRGSIAILSCVARQCTTMHNACGNKDYVTTPRGGGNMCNSHAQGLVAMAQSLLLWIMSVATKPIWQHQELVATCAISTFQPLVSIRCTSIATWIIHCYRIYCHKKYGCH